MLTNNCTGRKENLKDWVGLIDTLETDICHSTFKKSENNTSCLKIAIFEFLVYCTISNLLSSEENRCNMTKSL